MARLTPLLFSFSFTCNLICTGFRWKRRAHIHIETQTDKQLSTDRKHEALWLSKASWMNSLIFARLGFIE